MGKILFVSAHTRDQVPCQRFRFEQYIEYLTQNGFETTFSPLLDTKDYLAFYDRYHYPQKLWIALRGVFRRMENLLNASNFDIIFIQRETMQLGTTLFESLFAQTKAKLVFDFDDAIWIPDISEGNRRLAWLKNPEKTGKIISLCDMIFAGNRYLADYAGKFNNNIRILPTTIDTDQYVRPTNLKRKDDRICIGWSGSHTTIKHFQFAIPFLRKIKQKYGERVYFKVIGSGGYEDKALGIRGLPWLLSSEVEDLSSFDIGMMPLPDDDWAKGKCGLKGLQFMALEIPTVMSPVGVNSEIIQDGYNGFLAETETDWIEKFSALIESVELRHRIGEAGRKTVVERYSVLSQRDRYVSFLNEVIATPKRAKNWIGLTKPALQYAREDR